MRRHSRGERRGTAQVDADADDERSGSRVAARGFDEDAADFRPVDEYVVWPFEREPRRIERQLGERFVHGEAHREAQARETVGTARQHAGHREQQGVAGLADPGPAPPSAAGRLLVGELDARGRETETVKTRRPGCETLCPTHPTHPGYLSHLGSAAGTPGACCAIVRHIPR